MKKGKELISNDLRIAKEQCTDKVRYKKVKLDKYIKNRETTSRPIVTKNCFSKHWKDTRPEEKK